LQVMPYSTTSVEERLQVECNHSLTFNNIEIYRDVHVIVIALNVENKGQSDELISRQQFMLADGRSELFPDVGYMSTSNKSGKLWTWIKLRPDECCSIILRYQQEPKQGNYELKYLTRQHNKHLKS